MEVIKGFSVRRLIYRAPVDGGSHGFISNQEPVLRTPTRMRIGPNDERAMLCENAFVPGQGSLVKTWRAQVVIDRGRIQIEIAEVRSNVVRDLHELQMG